MSLIFAVLPSYFQEFEMHGTEKIKRMLEIVAIINDCMFHIMLERNLLLHCTAHT